MIYGHAKVSDIQIAYIGGGSRGWAWGLMADLAMDEQISGTLRLYDIDSAAARRNCQLGERLQQQPGVRSAWQYKVSDTLAEALTGADFVIISILPGTFAEMHSDVHTPEKYGVWQSVGDTVGPGGFVRALRTIPMFVEFAEGIRQYCPEAWIINYTNPMSVCVRTLYKVFPRIKAFGCCHEVFGTQKLLVSMLEDQEHLTARRQDIKVNVVGINHFTWFTEAAYQGQDLIPLYASFADQYYETGFTKGADHNWMNNHFACSHRVKFDLFRRYRAIAAAGDRHLAEFCSGRLYLDNPEQVCQWGFSLTPVAWREQDLKERLERQRRLLDGREQMDLGGTGEEGHLQMKAILGLSEMVTNINLPNQGQIPNLPLGAVVETNAVLRGRAVRPVFSGNVPDAILPLVYRQVCNQENTVTAALTLDRKLAESTFANDPLLDRLNQTERSTLLADMLQQTKAYLPAGWAL
ncbi:MAG: alpha-glucosidase/alpha-galactosidase [Oscillospiraceae bacterium]|nr:alpha-glucosidase/alpha-galactosidase [Oscillospiraceae bacterium]MDD4368673.1 alpha-glucosidase/alpha-galactosidase [Oscillospiraceae bacterium]